MTGFSERGRPRPMSLTFKASGFQAVPVDVPVRWSGFLERGRPRPLNPPLMQTQPVLVWLERRARCIRSLGLMVPQADGDVRAPVNPTTFTVGIQDHYKQLPHL